MRLRWLFMGLLLIGCVDGLGGEPSIRGCVEHIEKPDAIRRDAGADALVGG